MRLSRFFHWHAAKAVVLAVAVVGTFLLIGGGVNATPSGGNLQLTGAIAATTTTTKLITSPASPVVQAPW